MVNFTSFLHWHWDGECPTHEQIFTKRRPSHHQIHVLCKIAIFIQYGNKKLMFFNQILKNMAWFVKKMAFHDIKLPITYVKLKEKKDKSSFHESCNFNIRAKTCVFFCNCQKQGKCVTEKRTTTSKSISVYIMYPSIGLWVQTQVLWNAHATCAISWLSAYL